MKTRKDPTWDDIIFENRNKTYGAYELRTHYRDRLTKSFGVTIACCILLIIFSQSQKQDIHQEVFKTTDSVIFSAFTKDWLPEIVKAKSNTPNSGAKEVKPDEHTFIPVKDSVVQPTDEEPALADAGPADTGEATGDTVSPGEPGPSSDPERVFSPGGVDSIPEFPGGLEKFYKYLLRKIRFSEEAVRDGLNKKSYVRFTINEEGLVSDVVVMNKIGFGIDEIVRSVLINSPKWKPGLLNSAPVKTQMILPFNFQVAK